MKEIQFCAVLCHYITKTDRIFLAKFQIKFSFFNFIHYWNTENLLYQQTNAACAYIEHSAGHDACKKNMEKVSCEILMK